MSGSLGKEIEPFSKWLKDIFDLKKLRAQRDNKALKGRPSIAWGAASNASETPGQEDLSSCSPERAD